MRDRLAKREQSRRAEIRRRMKRWGMPEGDIDRCIEQIAERQKQKREGTLELHAPLCTLPIYKQFLRRQPGVVK